MKATTTILAAIFTRSINVLIASNNGAVMNTETTNVRVLAPVTPSVADFSDGI